MWSRWRIAYRCCAAACILAVSGFAAPTATDDRFVTRDRSFELPFEVDPVQRPLFSEIQLHVSTDFGRTWRYVTSARPTDESIPFTAPRDGEYWFAIRTIDRRGRGNPEHLSGVAPGKRILIDSTPPQIELRAIPASGDQAAVAWSVRDEDAALNSFLLEYRVRGEVEWRPVEVAAARSGEARWRPTRSGPLEVRLQVRDRAGNSGEERLTLPSNAPIGPNRTLPPTSPMNASNSPADFSNTSAPGPNFPAPSAEGFQVPPPPPSLTAVDDFGRAMGLGAGGSSGSGGTGSMSAAPASPSLPSFGSEPSPAGAPPGFADSFTPAPGLAPRSPTLDGFSAAPPLSPQSPSPTPPPKRAVEAILVGTTKFAIDYEVEVGKSGLNRVDLYYTLDGGRSWHLDGPDDDGVSPFDITVAGEGLYGFTLVATNNAGLADEPPKPGTPPQVWVEVDLTPPELRLLQVVPGQGANQGKLLVRWEARDKNLEREPIDLFYAEDASGPWQVIARRLPNSGQHIWTMPDEVPYRFYVRVEARDRAGKVARDETVEPTLVDFTKPRLRVRGVQPHETLSTRDDGRR